MTITDSSGSRPFGQVISLPSGVSAARVDCLSVVIGKAGVVDVVGSRPLVIASHRLLNIDGTLRSAGGPAARPMPGIAGAAGGSGGTGASGRVTATSGDPAGGAPGAPGTSSSGYGGGGGSFGSDGGASYGPLDLKLLHGGGGGGGGARGLAATGVGGGGGGGGGALLLLSSSEIRLGATARVSVRGGDGGPLSRAPGETGGGGGGGAGGALQISAPLVRFSAPNLDAAGGSGGVGGIEESSGPGRGGTPGHIRIHATHHLGAVGTNAPTLPALPPVAPVDPIEGRPRLVSATSATTKENDQPTVWRTPVDSAGGTEESQVVRMLTDDGRFLLFSSAAATLVEGDDNNTTDVFVYDRDDASTELVSVGLSGASASGSSFAEEMSADGRFVLFRSDASDLVENGDVPGYDLFRRDRETGVTELVSEGRHGTGDLAPNAYPPITAHLSADGSTVAFLSPFGTKFTPHADAPIQFPRIYAWRNGEVQLVSVNMAGTTSVGAFDPAISADGSVVAFRSASGAIASTPKANCSDCGNVFVRFLDTHETRMVSVNVKGTASLGSGPTPYAPQISSDGRYVTFWAEGSGLVSDFKEEDYLQAIYQRDLESGVTRLVSRPERRPAGVNVASPSFAASDDGRFIAFASAGLSFLSGVVDFCDLAGSPPQLPGCRQVYLHDMSTGDIVLVSRTTDGYKAGGSGPLRISADGAVVVFEGTGPLLAGSGGEVGTAPFRFQLSDQRVQRVAAPGQVACPNRPLMACVALSRDGTTIAFQSAQPLSAGDSDDSLLDAYLTTNDPASRGIAETIKAASGMLSIEGHVPCPTGTTEVAVAVKQRRTERKGSTNVSCRRSSERWKVRLTQGGVEPGKATACASAVTTDDGVVVNEIAWCRPVEITARRVATSETLASRWSIPVAAGAIAVAGAGWVALRRRRKKPLTDGPRVEEAFE